MSLGFDISYTAKVAQMPILAVCFMYSIKNDQTRNQAYWGLFFAAGITAAALGLSSADRHGELHLRRGARRERLGHRR